MYGSGGMTASMRSTAALIAAMSAWSRLSKFVFGAVVLVTESLMPGMAKAGRTLQTSSLPAERECGIQNEAFGAFSLRICINGSSVGLNGREYCNASSVRSDSLSFKTHVTLIQ